MREVGTVLAMSPVSTYLVLILTHSYCNRLLIDGFIIHWKQYSIRTTSFGCPANS